jgi:hypothetical protein
MNKIIIIVDLGHFKAFRVSKEAMESPRVTLIESYDSIEAHGKLGDKLSDSAGRFKRGDKQRKDAKGYGEPHNIRTETNKRLVKLISKDINDLIVKENYAKWDLAAPSKINKQILDHLSGDVRAKVGKSITSNLTKTPKNKILSYFK